MNAGPVATSEVTTVSLDGAHLTVEDVVRVARTPGSACRLTDAAARAVDASRALKFDLMAEGIPIYGVTTGFGDSADGQISPAKADELQRNMVRYHRNGTGEPVGDDMVRATLLIRANCLARGNSAVSRPVLDRLLDLLRHDVLPVVPERGSVGASGDLVPLSYVASVLAGYGRVRHHGVERDAGPVLAELGLAPVPLEAKDALALVNGTSFSAAVAVLALDRAEGIARLADVCTALATEALGGNRGDFATFVHQHKPHPGQVASATVVRRLLHGSGLARSHREIMDGHGPIGAQGFRTLHRNVQDRYSIRCAPHVTGVLRDTATWVRDWLTVEVNSSNDNPLFDATTGTVHSGGNFYGGHVVAAMDALRSAVANIADLLDRQLQLLVDDRFSNGLPPNLIAPVADADREAGLHHGFKGMQIACSAITAEALQACMPVSVFSRSTEAHNQDKVSMAPISARATHTVTGLVREVAAIHLLAACQALDLRGRDRMSGRTAAVHRTIRAHVPFADRDRAMDEDIRTVLELIDSGAVPTGDLAW